MCARLLQTCTQRYTLMEFKSLLLQETGGKGPVRNPNRRPRPPDAPDPAGEPWGNTAGALHLAGRYPSVYPVARFYAAGGAAAGRRLN